MPNSTKYITILLLLLCSLQSKAQRMGSFKKEDYQVTSLALKHMLGDDSKWRIRYKAYKDYLISTGATEATYVNGFRWLDSLDSILIKIDLKVAMTGKSIVSTEFVYDEASGSDIELNFSIPDSSYAAPVRSAIRLKASYKYDAKKLTSPHGFTIIRSKQIGNGLDPIINIAVAKPTYNKARNRCVVYYEWRVKDVGCFGFVFLAKLDEDWQVVEENDIDCK